MSHTLTEVIKYKIPEWNCKIFSLEDIPGLCNALKVGYVEAAIAPLGEYVIYNGIPIIVVKKNLGRPLSLWVVLHELGHHLLHHPLTHHFSKTSLSRLDYEANFFAAIAMMPTHLCRAMSPSEIKEFYGYPEKIIEIRREITELFKL